MASELGDKAKILVREITPLVRGLDPHTQWCALESIMVCSYGEDAGAFAAVLQALEDELDSIRQLAMRLISNASLEQLEAGLKECLKLGLNGEVHAKGLGGLLSEKVDVISHMINDPDLLMNKYGAISAKRMFQLHPQLLERASGHPDPDVRRFLDDVQTRKKDHASG